MYIGKDAKIVYPILTTIKKFLNEQNWIKTAFSIKRKEETKVYILLECMI